MGTVTMSREDGSDGLSRCCFLKEPELSPVTQK